METLVLVLAIIGGSVAALGAMEPLVIAVLKIHDHVTTKRMLRKQYHEATQTQLHRIMKERPRA